MPLGYPSASTDENYHMVFARAHVCARVCGVYVCALVYAVSPVCGVCL